MADSIVSAAGGVWGGEPGPFRSGCGLLGCCSGLPPAAVTVASLPTIESMLKPIFCLGVGNMTAEVGTGGIILVINTRVDCAGEAAISSAILAAFVYQTVSQLILA